MKRRIALLVGSRSDIPHIRDGINTLRIAEIQGLIELEPVYVCSAHRNPGSLTQILGHLTEQKVDVIIVVAGKLAAIFGNVDAYLRNELGNKRTRVIPVPLKGKTEQASQAALYSVLEVPNHKLVFEEEFFHDPTTAFEFAISGPLPEIQPEKQKPAEILSAGEAYNLSRIKYPGRASYDDVIGRLEAAGLFHKYTGKTRETFINPKFPGLLYILATDRISIFDIVLNARIGMKGAVLTAMTIYWLTEVFADVPNHLVAFGEDIVDYLPAGIGEEDHGYLMKHLIVVKSAKVLKVEAIVRGSLTGSGFADYRQTGKVCGINLRPGLVDGDTLPVPLFTPSTKAPYGLHDENISFAEAAEIIGEEEAKFVAEKSVHVFSTARELARKVGITIADTKLEWGFNKEGKIILVDEVITPDSSRFWPEEGRVTAMKEGRTPPSLDKQPIRDAGKAAGVKENPDWIPSDDLLAAASLNYQKICLLLTGKPLQQFWSENMGIKAA